MVRTQIKVGIKIDLAEVIYAAIAALLVITQLIRQP
jgi:hypothetical protein